MSRSNCEILIAIFGAGVFVLNYVWLYRMVWLSGRFGGGKTSLAIAIAQWLCAKSYSRFIASNIELSFGREVHRCSADELRRYDCKGPIYRDMVILMDESWMYLGKGTSRKQITDWLAFMRKGNNFLLMPSVLPLVADVTVLKVKRIFNGLVMGAPLWLYKWKLGESREGDDHGFHLFSNPARVFGLYDTKAIPSEEFIIYEIW